MEDTKHSDYKNSLRLREEPELWRIIGSSKEIKDVLSKIQTVLESDVPVVIQGETGTGKELVTKAIHYRGPRSKQSLCTINCAAIPENLLESELM
jgi:transcriptional regulator with GAF, ATPase, and Fis domain